MTTWIPIEQADIDWDAEPPMSYRLILLLPTATAGRQILERLFTRPTLYPSLGE